MGGDEEITLNSFGIEQAERHEKAMAPNHAETIKQEVEAFLVACCEVAEYHTENIFNAYQVGCSLGYDLDKSKRYYFRLKQDGYFEEPGLRTVKDTKCVITVKALNAVQGPMFGKPEGINVTNNNVTIGGDVNNSAIAAGSENVQSLSITTEQKDAVQAFLEIARTSQSELGLDDDAASDYGDHLDMIEGIVVDENPQPQKIKRELRGLKRIAEGAVGGAIGSAGGAGIVEGINTLLALL